MKEDDNRAQKGAEKFLREAEGSKRVHIWDQK